jgi:uncharacterized surface protein with fasciclin (FAS1) repeats
MNTGPAEESRPLAHPRGPSAAKRGKAPITALEESSTMHIPSLPRFVAVIGVGAAITLAAAACSDDEDSSTTTSTEAPAEEVGTIVDVAAGNEDFSTLVTAVTAADLAETLSGDGPFTVFAPTDDAFAALPAGTLDDLLLPENKDTLTAILTYHVVAGEVMSADLTDGQEVETVQGEILTVGVTDSGVTLTDASGNTVNVVTADVDASNGVIHAIDGVLIPAAAS